MERVTFGKFLENTSTYERTPVRIDAGLRRGVWISLPLLCACMSLYWFLPQGSYLRNTAWFMWTKGWLSGTWDFTADHRQWILILCSFVIAMTLALSIPTRAYQIAEINLHILLFIPVIFTALNLGFVIVLLFPVMANLLAWLLCLLLGIVAIGVFWGILLFLFAR